MLTDNAVFCATFASLYLLFPPTYALSSTAQHSDEASYVPYDPNFVPSDEERENYWNHGGNTVVHEIWSILRDFEPTWKDSVTQARSPSGLVDTIWYYTKTVLRFLFINTPSKEYENDGGGTGISGDLAHAVETLMYAAQFDDPDAMFLLAEMNFHGNFSHPRNFVDAFMWYSDLASLDGNSTAQNMIGLLYSTGLGGIVQRDQAKALLYHTFAADQGNVRSEMTVAFRHHVGIGTPKDCDKACHYYKRVADKAMAYWLSGPPGGMSMIRNSYRWSDDVGGFYGEGASAVSAGPNAQDNYLSMEDLLDIWEVKERQGDYTAVLNQGIHYYSGNRGYRRNMRKALKQFMKIARVYWGKDGKVSSKAPRGIEKIAGKAAAYLGRMALRGEGIEQNFEKAAMWFRRGIAEGEAYAQYHLGLMHRDGLGVQKDGLRAASLLKAAAEQNLYVAQSALGVLFLDQGDIETASRYFQLAASAGVMEAFYYLAELSNKGVGRERNCGLAVAYYKLVAERVETMHSAFVEANTAYTQGDRERALIASIMAAEQGYEAAQANVAYLLDDKTSSLSFLHPARLFSYFSGTQQHQSSLLHNRELALIYFTRSARQNNADALVKMGDYYLSGLSTSPANLPIFTPESSSETDTQSPPDPLDLSTSDPEKASACYAHAAESHNSAQSMWNLGWMHENGIGPVAQDFHMAKRYYDLALELNTEAYLPVKLALIKLRLRSWWNGVSGGKVNSIREDDESGKDGKGKRKKFDSLSDWLTHFLDAAVEDAEADARAAVGVDGLADDEAGPMPGGDEDDHYFASAGLGYGGAGDDLFDDGLVESLIIVGLAATLALLVWWRQQERILGERRRRLAQNAQAGAGRNEGGGEQRDGERERERGLFPNPGDPDWGQWVAGGVGH